MVSAAKRKILLCIDGSVKREDIGQMAKLGADLLVSGSAIFDGRAPAENGRLMVITLKSQAN